MAIFNFGFLLTQRSPRPRGVPGGEGSDCQEVAKETSFEDE